LGDIPDSELKPFLEDNVVGTMSQYIRRAVRRAEYSDHFGNRGEEIEAAVNEAKSAGLTPEQETIFRQTVSGMDGTLGADMSPQLRKLYSGMMTYQNVRLLPLQVLSSLIDPLGMMIRGGTLKDSMKAYGRALAGMHRFGGDVAHQMAKTTGSILDALDSSMMAEMANGNYMSPWAKNINQWFFRINGMERYNRIMRVTATEAAYDFIMRHATSPGADSERFLSELRLDSDYVKSKIGLDGRMDYNDERIRNAMNQWVDEAVLRPNPAFRSIMMNDPHWMLIAHLKQFTYQFQKVINERVLHEAKLGNYRPAMVLAGYVPVMMAADALRAGMMPNSPMAIQRQDWGPADYLWSGIQRTGMLGISQLGVDALQDPFHGQIPGASDLGPTVQQLLSFVQATGAQHGAMGKQIVRGIPGANIFYGSTLADVSPLTTD